MSILYIDDDAEDIEIFHEAVKAVDASIRYISARSCREAIEMLEGAADLPNHIVMDMNMPQMNGKRCLREFRAHKDFDSISFTLYSTNSQPSDVEEVERLQARFVRKANSFAELCSIIRNLVQKQ